MGTTALPAPGPPLAHGSKRLLATRGDDQLLACVRAGDGAAFEVLYERHLPELLSFCRHMLGSREEAEDAVQLVFVSAHQSIVRDGREIQIKPWLYTIARNRCLSLLRARRDHRAGAVEGSTAGLHDEVERRSDLRELVADLQDLPDDQRAALLLTELRDLSHVEVAGVLGCEPAKVKGLVFRAKSALIERREAREARCEEIRAELAIVRGGALRRGRLRHHLRACAACAAFRDDVRRQRQMIALVLPVAPMVGLKQSVMGAVGLGGGAGSAAGGAAAAAGGGAAAGTGVTAGAAAVSGGTAAGTAGAAGGVAVGTAAGSATLAKALAVAAIAGGAGAAGIGVAGSDDRPAGRTPAGQGQRATPQPTGHPRPSRRGSSIAKQLPGAAPGTAGDRGRAGTGRRGATGERPSSNARRRGSGQERGGQEQGVGPGKPAAAPDLTKQRPNRGGPKAPTPGGNPRRPATPSPGRRGPKRPKAKPPGRRGPKGPKAKPPGSAPHKGAQPQAQDPPSPPAGKKGSSPPS